MVLSYEKNLIIKACIVIPMYNEQASAEKCVKAINSSIETLESLDALIVVNDGSTDATDIVLKKLLTDYKKLTILNHNNNLGYGSALRTGTAWAINEGFDYVIFMDSDLTNDPKFLPLFIAKMQAGYDVIKASRYIKGGRQEGVPAWRSAISSVANLLASMLYQLNVRDCTNGFRAVKTQVLSQMDLQESGFEIIMEELYHAKFLDCSFCEVPYTLISRADTIRPSSFVYNLNVFYRYLKYPVKSFFKRPPEYFNNKEKSSYDT